MAAPPGFLPDAFRDRYGIERELGCGGMASVYLEPDLRLNRHVELKVLLPERDAVLGPERFLREIRVTAHLQHPGVREGPLPTQKEWL